MFTGRIKDAFGNTLTELSGYDNVYYLTEDLLDEVPGSRWRTDFEMTVWMEED